MTSTEMKKEHERFGGDFEMILMIIIYKKPIIIFHNSKGLLMVTNSESLYSSYE